MRGNLKINSISIISILSLMLGCSPESNTPLLPEFPQVAPSIFATLSGSPAEKFEAGDQIGIFPVHYVNGQPGTPGNTNDPINQQYTYDGKIWQAEAGQTVYLDDVQVDIYAYFPYDEEMGVTDDKSSLSLYPFDLSGDQNTKEVDFLWTKARELSNENSMVALDFHHLLSRIEINLYYETPVDEPDLIVRNLLTMARIDLPQGIARAQAHIQEPINPKRLSGKPGDQLFAYEAIVVPQFIEAGMPFLSLDYDGELFFFALPADILFESGCNYQFNLTLDTAKPRRRVCLIKDYIIK